MVAEQPDPDFLERHVRVAPTAGGGTEFRHGPARVPGAALGWSIATLIFGGGGALADGLGAPMLIVAVVALFTGVFILISFDLWLGVSVLEFQHGIVRHRHSWLGIGRTTQWDFGEIQDVRVRTGMTQQPTATQKARLWYDIEIRSERRPPRTVLRHLPTVQEADTVAAEMRQLLGVVPPGPV